MEESVLKEKTAKGIFWGGLGSFFQQFLSLLFGIVLARLLSPGDYGMVGMLAIFTALANAVQDSGLKVALINRRTVDPRDYNSVFWFNVLIASALYVMLWFASPAIADFFHTPELVPLARFVFLGIPVNSLGVSQLAYLSKNLMVREQTVANVSAALLSGIVGVVLAVSGKAYWSLAIEALVFNVVKTSVIWIKSPWRPCLKIDFRPVWEMFGFSVKLLVTNVFTISGNNIFSVLFGRFYSSEAVGYYSQANKWSAMGYNIINTTVSSVSQPALSSVNDTEDRQLRVFRKMVRFTAFISFPAMFGLALIAPEFITITITEKWLPSVDMLRIFCIWAAFYPVSSLLSTLVLTRGESGRYMWTNIALSSALIVALILLRRSPILVMVGVYAALNIIWTGIWFALVRKSVAYRWLHFASDLLPYLLSAAGTIALTWFVTRSISGNLVLLCSRIAIATVIYSLIMSVSKSDVFKDSIDYLLKKNRQV
ncbi:MAG: lipopolysaccharide biosynthesis protein [Bacteroidales bacterium]|nr:lipopolysaccharide biosynthesis protein [Bacteroidales bacterium]